MTDTDQQTDQQTDETPQNADQGPTKGSTAPEGTEGAIDGAEATEQPDTDSDSDSDETSGDEPNREAAKYRRRLRDAEADRDRLVARVEALQRAEVDRLAAEVHRIKPEALWASGANLAEMLTEDGTVDPDRVAVAAHAADSILGLKRRGGPHVPMEGRQPGQPRPRRSFADAFTPKAQ